MDYQDYQRALQFDKRVSGMVAMQSLMQILVDELDPEENDNVLDAGTGTGRLGIALHTIIPHGSITGIDSGYGMLRVAKEKIDTYQVDNFFLVLGRAGVLPFLSGVFDSACLMFSFHHFTDPEKALGEIYRTVKAGGYLVSVDPVLKEATNEEEKRLNKVIEQAFQLDHGPEFRFFTVTEMQKLYEDAGFSIETCQVYDFPFNQMPIEEVPMGPHWLQAYELLQSTQEKSLIKRFERNYFTFRKRGSRLLVKGKMSWAVVKAVKS